MSALYGTLQGCRGEATRCGTRNSGIRVSAQSWNGSLITYLDQNEKDEKPTVRLYVSDGSSCSSWSAEEVFHGTLDELKEAFNLLKDIKSGKVSTVRHRDPDGSKKLKKQLAYLGLDK